VFALALLASAGRLRGGGVEPPALLGRSALLALAPPLIALRAVRALLVRALLVRALLPVAALAARPPVASLFLALVAASIPAEALVRAAFMPPAETIALAPVALRAL
jgi:hypothetical protein